MEDQQAALEAEFRDLFQRILEVGRQQGERAALHRIIGMAQSALSDGAVNQHDIRVPEGGSERPTSAQGRSPLRPI